MITIARLAFREMLNKRILRVGLMLTILYLGLGVAGLHYLEQEMRDTAEMVRRLLAGELLTAGLFIGGVMVSVITILSSVGAISAEIENGIMPAIAAKPLSRARIFLGKYLGLGVALAVYSILVFLATNLMVGYTFGFRSDAYQGALVLFALQPLVLLGVSLWGSTFLSTLGNSIFMFVLYSLALVGGMVEFAGAQMATLSGTAAPVTGSSLTTAGIVTSLLLPVDSLYRMVNHLLLSGSNVPWQASTLNPFSSTCPPSSAMLAYALGYVLLFLGWGLYKFSRRDI